MTTATSLSRAQRASYHERGHLVVARIVPETFLDGMQRLLEELVEQRISQWRREGLLTVPISSSDFGTRYLQAWLAAGRPQDDGTVGDRLFTAASRNAYLSQDWLLALAAECLGAERASVLKSCFVRAKFPQDASTTLPWHQDAQCLKPISGTDFVTVWIPLWTGPEARSCIEVSPVGPGHQLYEAVWSTVNSYTCMTEADSGRLSRVEVITLRRGDLLVMNPYLPHRSVDNVGADVRWSVDLRFSPGPRDQPGRR
jgi:hypothetical protein